MRLKQLFKEDDAVSPVIGVILMVAITVILAAVIATFVLGLGEQVSDTAPQVTFEFDYDDQTVDELDGVTDSWGYNASIPDGTNGFKDGYENVTASSINGTLTITHTGGPTVEADLMGAIGSSATLYEGTGDTIDDDDIIETEYDDFSAVDEDIESWAEDGDMSAGASVTLFVANDDEVDVIWTSDDGGTSATLQSWDGPES